MRLYTFWRSSAAYRVRIALHVKGLEFESVAKQLAAGEHQSEAYLALNPQGLVPALEDSGVVLAQSLAIIEYLEETHPEPALLPAKPRDRALVRSLAQAIACDIHPLNNLRVLNYLRSPLGQDDRAVDGWYAHWIAQGLGALEKEVHKTSGDGRHMFGTGVTLADVFIVPQMYNARRFKCDLAPYPTLRAICANLEGLPAFARAAPEVQPEAQ